jgi:hypothetical protein
MAEWLTWEGERCELRLNSSAVRYFTGPAYGTSRKGFLRRSNRSFIRYVQGLTLVTLIHRDLIPRLRLDGSGGDYYPMISSSVSFDGDTMHKLKQDFVQQSEIEFRQMALLIHFSVLNGITEALPRELTQSIRHVRRLATWSQRTLWVVSLFQFYFGVSSARHHVSQDPLQAIHSALFRPLFFLLLSWIAPFVVRWLLVFCVKLRIQWSLMFYYGEKLGFLSLSRWFFRSCTAFFEEIKS